MYAHILLPTDGSDESVEALDHAVAIGEAHDATVHVLYVVDKRVYLAAAKEDQDDVLESLTEEGEAAVEKAAETLRDAGLDVETAVREGIPYREILRYPDGAPIDLIAIGTHGRTGRDKLANMGSVTERVVQNASVPVLVVHIAEP